MSAQASAEQWLRELDIALAPPPTPFGAYVEAAKIGDLLFLSDMLPVVGHEPEYVGRVGGALSAEDGRKAAEIACLGALSAAKAYLGSFDKITGVAKLGVYIATEGDFRDHPKVADGPSELLVKVFRHADALEPYRPRRRQPALRHAGRNRARFEIAA